MSEPEKKPAKVEPAIDDIPANDEIVGASPASPAVPATPAPAVVDAVNDNAEEATAPAAAPKSRLRGFLKGAFNVVSGMAMGAAVSAVAKTAAVVGMTIAGAPAWATILGSGVAVGIGSTLLHDFLERRKLKGVAELPAYFSLAHGKELLSKKNLKVFGLSTTFAIAGSALFLGLQSGTIQGWLGFGPEPAPAVPPVVAVPVDTAVVPPVVETLTAPPVDAAPVPHVVALPVETVVAAPICLSPTEQFAALIDGHDVSARVTDAIARSASTNAHVAAQGAKDLAFFAVNGFDGVPKDPHVAVELFKQAADAGNMQAKVDLLYMQYHGLGGVPADKTAALGAMQDMKGARAAMFVREWGGAGRVIEHVKFDTSTILKGMTVGCPTP